MATFDLIPSDYRHWLWLRACALRLFFALLGMVAAAVGAYVALKAASDGKQEQIDAL